MEYIRQ
jgi:5'-3' exonuclease